MTSTIPPAQASDEHAALSKQLTTWRAEVARLNDLIAHASGVQASDEPMRAAFFAWFAEHGAQHGIYKVAQDAFCAGYQAATSRATADVERDAARWRYWRKKYGAEWRVIPGPIWAADTPEKLDVATDLCMSDLTTKGAKS